MKPYIDGLNNMFEYLIPPYLKSATGEETAKEICEIKESNFVILEKIVRDKYLRKIKNQLLFGTVVIGIEMSSYQYSKFSTTYKQDQFAISELLRNKEALERDGFKVTKECIKVVIDHIDEPIYYILNLFFTKVKIRVSSRIVEVTGLIDTYTVSACCSEENK